MELYVYLQCMWLFLSPLHSVVQLSILFPNFNQISRTGEVLKITKFLKTLWSWGRGILLVSCLQARLPDGLSSYKAPENPYNKRKVMTNPDKCLQWSSKCLVWVYIYSILHYKMQIHIKVASLVMALSISFSFSDRNKINSFTQHISHAVNWKFSSTNFFFVPALFISLKYIYLFTGRNKAQYDLYLHAHIISL